jgi:hypothetical protein
MALRFLNSGYFAGKVGIGTDSPGAKLEISHSGSNDGLLLENTNNVNNYQIALNIRENEGLIYQRWTGGTFNANLMRIGYTGAIKFDAYDSTNNTGTPTYLLGTDASGNVVKTLASGGGAAPQTSFDRAGINSSTYTMLFTAAGTGYGSVVNMTVSGTSGNVVIIASFEIIVNHYQDIHVRSLSGDYTELTLRITSDNNASYSVEAKHNGSTTTTVSVCVQPQNNDTITPTTTDPAYAGEEYVHTATEGWRFGGTDGGVESSNLIVDGNVGIGVTSPAYKLDVAGTGNFTGLVSGITPVAADNFVTKAYVDGSGGGTGPFLPLAGGTMTGTNGVIFPDNFNLKIGTGSDLQIYHSGTESKINNDVGNLSITNFANDSDIIFSSDNGSGSTTPYLQLDGSHTQSIAWKDIHFVDGIKAKFGDYASPDLQIYHDGSNSYITDSGTGDLIITADNDLTFKDGSGNIMANMNASNSVELMFGNVKKFETTSTGVTVTGDIKIDSALLSNQENTDVDTGAEVVAQVSTSTYTAAFFDFVIKKVGNIRSGTVYACHDGTNVEFTETSTQDLGDTSDVTLSVDKSGTNLRLIATVTSDDWIIKSLIRAI